MLKKTAALVALAASTLFLATGCSSNNSDKPYGLTGEPSWNDELRERQRWVDDKGRYRSDWRHGHASVPPGYPKPLPR